MAPTDEHPKSARKSRRPVPGNDTKKALNVYGFFQTELEEFSRLYPETVDMRRFMRVMVRVLSDPQCPPGAELWVLQKGKEIERAIEEGKPVNNEGWAAEFRKVLEGR